MHDIRAIRENPAQFDAALGRRGLPPMSSRILAIDEARRAYTEFALFAIPCDAVVMNRLLPDEASREPSIRARCRLQDERRSDGGESFEALPGVAPHRVCHAVGGARRRCLGTVCVWVTNWRPAGFGAVRST